ncbi:hypothetical protein DSO57_1010742 [Entomophthora muscae]|uniref:Uncharacterized protein n=1 Tax=Entomophthora muscae TaxID=34485 RepID=A0ACC2SVB1_9FUNG|nr:hypothetical protein DSO57_1010742 [Entomophthora muscae]
MSHSSEQGRNPNKSPQIGPGAYVSFSEDLEYTPNRSATHSNVILPSSVSSTNGLTKSLITAALVVCLASFQFGYHTGELNTPKDIFTNCPVEVSEKSGILSLPLCIHLTGAEFSAVTGMFPLGGVVGSLMGGALMDKLGRRGTLVWSNLVAAVGSLAMTLSVGLLSMLFGRLLVGIAGGISLVVVPAYLAEIAPIEIRGIFGMCNQLALVSGIVVSQSLGLAYATNATWRGILVGGMAISVLQVLGFPFCPESPWFLIDKPGRYADAENSLRRLRARSDVDAEISERGLLRTSADLPSYSSDTRDEIVACTSSPLSLGALCKSEYYRPGLLMLLFLHLTQQMSGINAVMYYSTSILQTTFGESAKIVTVLVNVTQFLLTFCASQVVEKWGRRSLIVLSSGFMGIFSAVLAFSINGGYSSLSAISLFLSVGSFAFGLGPLPFMLASELFDPNAVGAASALGLTINLTFNFGIAATFLPFSSLFPADQPGSTFYVFSLWLLGSALIFRRLLPETRASSPQANLAKLSNNVQSLYN